MPYSDIGQGLMAAGGAFSDAIRERRLRREQEEEKRKQELLAMLQRQSMAKVLGPGNEDLLDAGLESATALAEKKRREDEKKSEKGRQDREKALRDAYVGGRPDPVPPDVESQIQLGAQETDPTQVMNLMNKLSRNQPTPDVAGNATMFSVDQNQLAALVGQGMSVSDAVTKLKSWQEKPDKDPRWQHDIAIRRQAEELEKTDPAAAKRLMRLHGLIPWEDKGYPQDVAFIGIKLQELNRLRREQTDARDNTPYGQTFVPKSESELDALATQSAFQIIQSGQQELQNWRSMREALEAEADSLGIQ